MTSPISMTTFKYDVAISFLNEDLGIAQHVHDLLSERMRVFLFTNRQEDLAGSDGVTTLSTVFRSDARIVVILFRNHWGSTPWTRLEEAAIKGHGLDYGWESILLVPLEPNPVIPQWFPRHMIWYAYAGYGVSKLPSIVERMLEEAGGRPAQLSPADYAQQIHQQGQWRSTRESTLRSDAAVAMAQQHVRDLFAALRDAAAGAVRFDSNNLGTEMLARVSTSEPDLRGTTVVIIWSQAYGNSLSGSVLAIECYDGFRGIGRPIIANREPELVEEIELAFDLVAPDTWRWTDKGGERSFDTVALAAECMRLLRKHAKE